MRLPLRTRLTLLYVTLFAIIVSAWAVFVVVLVRADLYSGIDRALDSRASQIALSLTGSVEGEFQDITGSTLVGVAPTEATAQLLSATGTVLESSGDTMSVDPLLPQSVIAGAFRSGTASVHTVVGRDGETFRVLIVRMTGLDQLIVVGTSTDTADASVQSLVFMMLLSGPVVLLVAGGAGWLLARRALSPVAHMTATASGIGIEALGERVPVPPGNDELSGLADTLNGMLDRLETGVRAKRRLVADASHELQTPIAVMRTELDVALASGALQPEAVEVLESAREETDHMARIVRNLLTLARFDEGTLRLLRQDVGLRATSEEIVASLATLARETGVTMEVSGDEVVVLADPEYLRVAVVNLVENAIKYSGVGSSVTVEVVPVVSGATVTVVDDGPGIAADALPRIFDRFYRADGTRGMASGSGLGLAISREIVEAHGGRLEVDSRVSGGSRFTLWMPTGQGPAGLS